MLYEVKRFAYFWSFILFYFICYLAKIIVFVFWKWSRCLNWRMNLKLFIEIYANNCMISETECTDVEREGKKNTTNKVVMIISSPRLSCPHICSVFQFGCVPYFSFSKFTHKVTNAINLLIIVKWTTNKTQDFANRIRLL